MANNEELAPLLDHCVGDVQRSMIEQVIASGSVPEACEVGGWQKTNVYRAIRNAKRSAAKVDFKQYHNTEGEVPDGYAIKGTSTLYDDQGKVKIQWVKSTIDAVRQQDMMREAVGAMCEEIKPVKPSTAAIIDRDLNIINQYTITDYHFGMLAWEEETGAPWDLDIAEKTLVSWFERAIELSPKAESCIFAQLGDMLHFDGLQALTPTSGHILDADTRFQKVVRIAIRSMRRIIDMLLVKYKHVHVIMAEGNHDLASSVWLRELFAALYTDDNRITVETSPDIYYAYEFGKTALFYHHGHKKRVGQLDTVFVSKFREMYGRTEFHYGHSGHLHHDVVRESNLLRMEQHRTLAAPDSHASRGGWMSKRDAKVITYSKTYGEVSRATVSFDSVRDLWID